MHVSQKTYKLVFYVFVSSSVDILPLNGTLVVWRGGWQLSPLLGMFLLDLHRAWQWLSKTEWQLPCAADPCIPHFGTAPCFHSCYSTGLREGAWVCHLWLREGFPTVFPGLLRVSLGHLRNGYWGADETEWEHIWPLFTQSLIKLLHSILLLFHWSNGKKGSTSSIVIRLKRDWYM